MPHTTAMAMYSWSMRLVRCCRPADVICPRKAKTLVQYTESNITMVRWASNHVTAADNHFRLATLVDACAQRLSHRPEVLLQGETSSSMNGLQCEYTFCDSDCYVLTTFYEISNQCLLTGTGKNYSVNCVSVTLPVKVKNYRCYADHWRLGLHLKEYNYYNM